MKTLRAVRHRDRGRRTLNERKYFYVFSAAEKIEKGIMPNIPEQRALLRIGIEVERLDEPNNDRGVVKLNVNISVEGRRP